MREREVVGLPAEKFGKGHKIDIGAAKMDPAKAEENASTKLHSQVSFLTQYQVLLAQQHFR
jgi:hypothetical protein